MTELMKNIIKLAIEGPLSEKDATDAFAEIISGNTPDGQIAGFLIALKCRGETVTELTAAAKAMLRKCKRVKAPKHSIDIVGTGGDGKGTLNISTATALVVASTGAKVAKHGNRNISSQSGAADVLEKIGVKTSVVGSVVEECIKKANIGFMMAPIHHPAVKNVMPTRQILGVRTIFNILGPLTNPARVKYHLIGAYKNSLLEPMASTLKQLGSERAWLVHGSDGTDEISIAGPTQVIQLSNNKLEKFEITPADAGLPTHTLSEILGGSPKSNAIELESLIKGKITPYRNAVLLNSAAALLISGRVTTLLEGAELARTAIDTGATQETLRLLSKITTDSLK